MKMTNRFYKMLEFFTELQPNETFRIRLNELLYCKNKLQIRYKPFYCEGALTES